MEHCFDTKKMLTEKKNSKCKQHYNTNSAFALLRIQKLRLKQTVARNTEWTATTLTGGGAAALGHQIC